MPKVASFRRQSRLRSRGLNWPIARETPASLLSSRAILHFTKNGGRCGTLAQHMAIHRPPANNKKRQADERPGELAQGVHTRGITIVIYLFLAGISLAVFAQTLR